MESLREQCVEIESEPLKKFMLVAFELARNALQNQEVPIGCVFVYRGEIIAAARNTVNETHNATRHAELNCIDKVVEYCKQNNLDYKSIFNDITVYVTVEPCIMCIAILYKLNVKCIKYGCQNDRFGGVTAHDVGSNMRSDTSTEGGYYGEMAMNLLKEFYKGTNPNAPVFKRKK